MGGISAGELRHRVTLESPPTTPDAVGWPAGGWTARGAVYAAIEPISGREAYLAAQRQAATTHIVKMRYSSIVAALDETWRLKYGTRIFQVEQRLNLGECNRELELRCIEITT